MKNPYLRKFSQLHSNRITDEGFYTQKEKKADKKYNRYRDEWVKKYAWAIPNAQAIERIVEESPIIEIGAGTGYWAWLIDQKGGDIKAFDIDPPEDTWYDVHQGDETMVLNRQHRTLFLSWVNYNEEWGTETLKLYEGDTVIVVGEGSGGCTGDENFHSRLAHNWELKEIIGIPKWRGIHDNLRIYKRK